jgi:hypothetical protein
MIAIVPDPVQTHLPLRFDRAIDAIELAAESMKYVLDRYWLPWDLDPKADWTDYESFQATKKDRNQKEREPGLLMFRWEGEPEEAEATVLYVFLVGESPTAGVNGEQFVNAVCYADLLNEFNRVPDKPHPCPSNRRSRDKISTYVLGPTSSGSYASLAELIEDYPSNKFVINTTARNSLAIQAISDNNLKLSIFIMPVPQVTQTLEKVLKKADQTIDEPPCHEKGEHQVAILSEASTQLGSSFDVPGSDTCADLFRYPREIASLRNAYGASNVQNPPSGDKTAGPRPSLSVNLTDITNRSDEPPDFSKAQSPLSQEATLMAFAAEMQRKHYRYIGLNASNPLDLVFLESFLRRAVPNARLFSFDSDLLLEHEPDNVDYIGTLSVTTYPLLYPPLNQIGNQSGELNPIRMHTHLPFTSQREEGLYNVAICTARKMLKQPTLGFLSELEACPKPESRKASRTPPPPLWLTVFGAGGHWPIEVLVPREKLPKVPNPDLTNLPLPSSWKAVCTLLLALTCLHVLLLFGLAPFSPKFEPFKLGTVAPARQLFGIHAASATLALALFLVASSAWRRNPWTWVSVGAVWILPGACWFLTVIKYFRCWWADRTKVPMERYLGSSFFPIIIPLQIFFITWLGAVKLAFMWWTLRNDPDGHYGVFFSFRAANMASIISPLTPMLPLLAAIYLGAIFYVWHLLFNDKIRPRLRPNVKKPCEENKPPLGLELSSGKSSGKKPPGSRSDEFIAKAVNGDNWNIIIGCLILSLWVMVFLQPQFELFERPQFQLLFELLFCLVILLILVSGVRLARIWQTLQRFLLEINRRRARDVFRRLKADDLAWSSLWFYGSEDADWDYMVRSHGVLKELQNIDKAPPLFKDVDDEIEDIHDAKNRFHDEGVFRAFHVFGISKDDSKLENAMSRAQNLLAATLTDVLHSLQAIWDKPASTPEGMEWQRLLEKYVALRWAAFIRAVIGRIRLLIIFLAISFSLAMISLVVYSFEPHRELLWSVTALFIVIGFLTIRVLIQMHSDPILSYITVTKPGRLDFAFYIHLVTLGTGPLVTLLAIYSPSLVRYVLSFLQPGLEALK